MHVHLFTREEKELERGNAGGKVVGIRKGGRGGRGKILRFFF